MSTPIRCAVVTLSLALSSIALPAQQPSSPPAPPDAGTIHLNVVVAPKSGKPVAGLQKQDFSVLDNNVSQPITTFEAVDGTQAPLEIVLVVDAVNMDFHKLAYERQEIEKFLKSNGGHLAHPILLAIFTDAGIQLEEAPSADGNQLSSALDKADIGLREIHRDSQYGEQDRFNLSLKALYSLLEKESANPGHKVIFWLSPGWPLLSGPRIDLDAKQQQYVYSQVIAMSNALRRGNITLYSVDTLGASQGVDQEFYYQDFLKGVTRPSQANLGNLALQVIAIQSGGLAVSASNDIAAQLEKCMADTAAYYRISYAAPPAEHPGEYHAIDVKVSSPGLATHTLTGYYAGPPTTHP